MTAKTPFQQLFQSQFNLKIQVLSRSRLLTVAKDLTGGGGGGRVGAGG